MKSITENSTTSLAHQSKQKSLIISYLLLIPWGLLGLHYFYLGFHRKGFLFLITFGLVGIGWIYDVINLPYLVEQANCKVTGNWMVNKRKAKDAYFLWFFFGLFGFHHYYLGRRAWGISYMCTLGLCGIGWLLDGFRMLALVKRANKRLGCGQNEEDPDRDKHLSDAYVLVLSPFGIIGAHHYYLENWIFAVLYTCTGGLLGIGWIIDIFMMKSIYKRAVDQKNGDVDPLLLYLDEAYKLYLPLGILGFHHFYLKRTGWGVLYFLTGGIFILGWLIDCVRIPYLVKESNCTLAEMRKNITYIKRNHQTHQVKRGIFNSNFEFEIITHSRESSEGSNGRPVYWRSTNDIDFLEGMNLENCLVGIDCNNSSDSENDIQLKTKIGNCCLPELTTITEEDEEE